MSIRPEAADKASTFGRLLLRARMAGLSVSTVANVLSRPSIIAPRPATGAGCDRRRRICAQRAGPAAARVAVAAAVALSVAAGRAQPRRRQCHPSIWRTCLRRGQPGIEDRLAQDARLLLACNTDLRSAEEKRLLGLLRAQAVRGVIVSPTGSDPAPPKVLSHNGIPLVLLYCPRGRQVRTQVTDTVTDECVDRLPPADRCHTIPSDRLTVCRPPGTLCVKRDPTGAG